MHAQNHDGVCVWDFVQKWASSFEKMVGMYFSCNFQILLWKSRFVGHFHNKKTIVKLVFLENVFFVQNGALIMVFRLVTLFQEKVFFVGHHNKMTWQVILLGFLSSI